MFKQSEGCETKFQSACRMLLSVEREMDELMRRMDGMNMGTVRTEALRAVQFINNFNHCHALTKKGVRCRNYASDGPRWMRGEKQFFCHRHRTYKQDLLVKLRMTHLRRVFRAAVNMIIVHKRYINDYYKPGGKGAKMAAIEFKAMA